MRRAVRAMRTAISPRLAIRTDENMRIRSPRIAAILAHVRAGRETGRAAQRAAGGGGAGAICCGAGAGFARAGARVVVACCGLRGGKGAAAGGACLTSGVGSAFMMLTAGIEAAEGKSYFGETGTAPVAAGAAGGAEAVVKFVAPSATGVAAFGPRADHSPA